MTNSVEKRGPGRPTLYSDEMAWRIASRIADGMTLAEVCQMKDTPALMTVLQWQREKPDFHSLIMRAREAQAETWFTDMRNEALKANDDTVKTAQLRIGTMQWMMARMYPKKFSERVLAELAKVPEPEKKADTQVDTQYMTYEERELFKQLLLTAKNRREAMLIEHEPIEGESNDEPEPSTGDDQSGDPASG